MKKKLFVFIIMMISTFVYANAQTTFQKAFGTPTNNLAYCVQQTNDGNYIAAGGTVDFIDYDYDFFVVKLNTNGDTIWTRVIGSPFYDETANSIQQTNDSGYIICGERYQTGVSSKNIFLVKTNATGNVQWTKTFDAGNIESGVMALQTNDGGYIILGLIEYPIPRICVIKTNAVGDTTWTQFLNTGLNAYDVGSSIQQTTDGGYIITGQGYVSATNNYLTLIKTDSTGAFVWAKSYNGLHYGKSVQQTTDGGFIISGYTYTTNYNVLLIKTNASGDTLWTRSYGGSNVEQGYSVKQTNDGGYIIAGESRGFGAGLADAYLIKTDSTGMLQWSKVYGGGSYDMAYFAQQTSDGGFVATGQTLSFGLGLTDLYLIKTDSGGNTGCHEMNAGTLVTVPQILVGSPIMYQTPIGISVSSPIVQEGSGATVTSLCVATGITNNETDFSFNIFPNPVSPNASGSATFSFSLPQKEKVSLRIFDTIGRSVATLADGLIAEGESKIEWNVANEHAGIYFLKFDAGNYSVTKKILVIK